ncbi:MAG: ectonucleotide pyrophosphatase/phosphodiesterase [Melioribacteraceae bacterium]|nr:ectonucleotide pyrophosphatase/phosphodiesterase [Melioribacteraceae bacterium]
MKKLFILLILSLHLNLLAGGKPYVILVSFDAFRWDYMDRGLTPNLSKFASEGVKSLSLESCFPSKTFPNHISIITGMYPENHGIIHNTIYNRFTNQTYKMSDSNQVRDPRWYLGEPFWETAERQGITTASYFWPGSELNLSYRRPTYFMPYDHFCPEDKKIDGIVNWLSLPDNERPHFITLYFHETDDDGHNFGPHSAETNKSILKLDSIAGLLLNRLSKLPIKDSINVVFLSDHGMTEISKERQINVGKILDGLNARLYDSGPVMMVSPSGSSVDSLYNRLKKNENKYKVYKREDIPEYFHFSDNPLIAEIVIVADMGWTLIQNNKKEYYSDSKGNHGYDNHHLDMHGFFIANGPAFRNNYRSGTLRNIDIYPMLCKIFDIFPRSNIDGKLERIEYILK